MSAEQRTTGIVNVPNAITAARIVVTPFLAWQLANDPGTWALATIVVGMTDALDGWIARRFNQQTEVGRILDPTADVFFTSSITIALGIAGVLPPVIWIGSLVQKALKSLVALWAVYDLGGAKLHVSIFGKMVEVVMVAGVSMVLLAEVAKEGGAYDAARNVGLALSASGVALGMVNVVKIVQQYRKLAIQSKQNT